MVDFQSTATGFMNLSWVDKKPLNLLSTIHNSEMLDLPQNQCRSQKEATGRHRLQYWDERDLAIINVYAIHRALRGTLTQLNF